LWKKYGLHAAALLPGLVAGGIIKEDEVPKEILVEIEATVKAMKEFRERWPDDQDESQPTHE